MELTAQNIISEIKKHLGPLQRMGVQEIGLFGSYNLGKGDSDSDIDILVQFKEGEKTFDNYMDVKFI